MAKKLTQKQRTDLQQQTVLAAAAGMHGVEQAVHLLHRASEAIAMNLAEPNEPLHGQGYKNRVLAIRQVLMSSIPS